MNIFKTFQIAIKALKQNKFRSILTSVGIVVGISSVIVMIGITNSARIVVKEMVRTYGQNAISISIPSNLINKTKLLSKTDMNNFKRLIPNIKYITPMAYGSKIFTKYKNKNIQTRVYGVNNDYLKMRDFILKNGRLFSQSELLTQAKVVLIGHTVHKKLFNLTNPIGKTILINNTPFKVLGYLEEKGEALSGRDFDNMVIIPHKTAAEKIFGRKDYNEIYISTISKNDLDYAVILLKNYFKWNYKYGDQFKINTSENQLKIANEISNILSILLVGIASISLLVGGIGIMNIMLVSVTERTREIGIRMAIGAKKSDILMQFIIESVTLCSFGGIIGIIIGIISYLLIIIFVDWPFIFSFLSIIISFSVACSVGIFFGYYPAKQAANKLPIEALKHE